MRGVLGVLGVLGGGGLVGAGGGGVGGWYLKEPPPCADNSLSKPLSQEDELCGNNEHSALPPTEQLVYKKEFKNKLISGKV